MSPRRAARGARRGVARATAALAALTLAWANANANANEAVRPRDATRARAVTHDSAAVQDGAGRLPPPATVWTRARDRDRAREGRAMQQVARVLAANRENRDLLGQTLLELRLREAKALLERANAGTSRDARVRLLYADLLRALKRPKDAAVVLEGALALRPPPPVLTDVLGDLAVTYAQLGRSREEIVTYERALRFEAYPPARAQLLANQAEAWMVTGNLERALVGYRRALAQLSLADLLHRGAGVTTLWGLGVALDRAGDLEGALASIQLARSYDPRDEMIKGPGWFYVPEYDVAYYDALGHWVAARATSLAPARAEAYGRALAAWDDYLARAPNTDFWLAVARSRRAECEAEKERALAAKPAARAPASKRAASGSTASSSGSAAASSSPTSPASPSASGSNDAPEGSAPAPKPRPPPKPRVARPPRD